MNFEVGLSESESEDEIINEILQRPRRKIYTVRPRPDLFNYFDDREFIARFRLSKNTVQDILNLIENQLQTRTNKNHAVSPLQQLLLTLRFYATGTFQNVIGDFGGLHKSTICRIIKHVSTCLAQLFPRFVHLPETEEEIRRIQTGFYMKARFPKVIGALDCTHIKISSPGGDEAEVYRCRKGYFSINVQAICDHKLKFLDVVAHWPGSTHDITVFRNSRIHFRFGNGEIRNQFLLGDSGYNAFENSDYLLIPLDRTTARKEELYNESQIRTRNVIERSFGIWKRRFPVLALGLRLKMETIETIIIATAVLHNIGLESNDPEPPVDADIERILMADLENDGEIVNGGDEGIAENARRSERRILINTYFARLANNNLQ